MTHESTSTLASVKGQLMQMIMRFHVSCCCKVRNSELQAQFFIPCMPGLRLWASCAEYSLPMIGGERPALVKVRNRGRGLEFRFPQEFRRLFRRDGIDIEPRAPFKAGNLHQLRNNFYMPVVVLAGLFMEGGTVQDEVKGRFREHSVHPPQRFGENRRQEFELLFLAFFEVTCMPLGEDPHFEREPRREGRHAGELGIFGNDPVPFR